MKRVIAIVVLAAAAVLALLVAQSAGQIDFALIRVDRTDPKHPVGFFRFRQTAKYSLPVYGFAQPTDAQFHPRFIGYQILTNEGWHRRPIFYCGTGQQTYSLYWGCTYMLKIELYPFTNATDRVRVAVASTDPQATYWSSPFRLSDYERESR